MAASDRVRELALSLPDVTSGPHHDREAFKVAGKVFATLGGDTVNLMLTPEAQGELLAVLPDAAEPCAGAWGRQGSTALRFARVAEADVGEWLAEAHRIKRPPPRQARPVVA